MFEIRHARSTVLENGVTMLNTAHISSSHSTYLHHHIKSPCCPLHGGGGSQAICYDREAAGRGVTQPLQSKGSNQYSIKVEITGTSCGRYVDLVVVRVCPVDGIGQEATSAVGTLQLGRCPEGWLVGLLGVGGRRGRLGSKNRHHKHQ